MGRSTELSGHGVPDDAPHDFFERIVQLSPIPMAIHSYGKVLLANNAAANLIGENTAEDLIGKEVLAYVHVDSQPAVRKRMLLLAQGRREYTESLEEKLVRTDGTILHVEIVSLLIDFHGTPAIQLILQDVTKQRLLDQELRRAKDQAVAERQRLYDLLQEVPAMVAITRGPSHVFELANTEFLRVTGKKEDIVGKTVEEVFPEVHDQVIVGSLASIYKTGMPYYGNEVLLPLDITGTGALEDRYFNFVYQPTRDTNGHVDGVMLHAIDVTLQVEARHEVQERERQYRNIFEASHDAILIFDMSGQLVEANPAALMLHGYTYDEITHLQASDLVHEDGAPVLEELMRQVHDGRTFHGVGTHRTKQGTPITAEITAKAMTYRQQSHLMAVVRDITERRQSEEALEYSNLLLKTVTDNASLGLFMLDARQRCTFMNRAAEEMSGYSFSYIQQLDSALHEIIHHSYPDGTDYPQSDCPIDATYTSKQRQRGEEFFVRADGTFYPVRYTASPIIHDSVAVGTVIEVEDMTEVLKTKEAYVEESLRRTELETITQALTLQRAQLIDLNKSKDEFISLASHQLRTPATAVKQYTSMVLEGYAGDLSPQMRSFIEKAYSSNERQLAIVSDLLKVAQLDGGNVVLQKKRFSLTRMVKMILDDHMSSFAERQQHLVTHLETALTIRGDQERLRMAVENIVDNASKYTPAGKTLTVSVAQKGEAVVVTIADEGVGMAASDVAKIFDKFVRIKNELSVEVGGTGLGLYWSQKIIKLHGGEIDVTSKLGVGTAFTVSLPYKS